MTSNDVTLINNQVITLTQKVENLEKTVAESKSDIKEGFCSIDELIRSLMTDMNDTEKKVSNKIVKLETTMSFLTKGFFVMATIVMALLGIDLNWMG